MKFNLNALMKSNPDFNIKAASNPVPVYGKFHTQGKGSIGPVNIGIKEVPLKLTIPFLKRNKGKPVLIGAVGKLAIEVEPISFDIEDIVASLEGRIGGKEGLRGEMKGSVDCQGEMDIDGDITGVIKPIAFDLGGDDKEKKDKKKAVKKIKKKAKKK